MSEIIVIGAGLLGSHIAKVYDLPVLSHEDIDITEPFDIDAVLVKYRPNVVINAAGIVPKSPVYMDVMQTLKVNAQGPKLLASACDEWGSRLVQISTNCVYSGNKGGYDEVEIPNPPDLYAMSKYLGEVTEYPHLTVRTSFVGYPDPKGRGLLAWAAQQSQVVGYDKYMWNGLTATELARVLMEVVIPLKLSNIIHLFGPTLSKYDLLQQAKEVYQWSYHLVKESDVEENPHQKNMTLMSELPDIQTKKSFQQQLEEMRELWRIPTPIV